MNVRDFLTVSIKPSPLLVVQGSVLLFLYLLLYSPLLPGLVKDWYEHITFSYGFLIPLIVIYLVWSKRKVLQTLPILASPWGWVSLLSAIFIGLIGKVIGDTFSMRISMVLTLAGLVHLFLGRQFLKALLFPLAYLSLMIPLPYILVKTFSYYLRLFDAVVTTGVLQTIAIPVYRDSYFLHLSTITLEVADDCSGASDLFALFALGALYSYILPIRLGPKIAIVASTVPFAILANLIRIILTSISVHYYGEAMLQVFFHAFSGTFIFLVALMLIIAFGEFLRRRYPERVRKATTLQANQEGESNSRRDVLSSSFLLALLILGFTYYLSGLLENRQSVPLPLDLRALPVRLGSYYMSERNWMDPYQDPNAEIAVSRVYENPGKGQVELYVGYRSYQYAESRLFSPQLRFVEGWNYVSIDPARFEIPGAEPIEANWMLTQKGDAKRLVLYWYQARGDTFAGELRFRIEQLKSLMLSGRTDSAVIRISTPVLDYEDLDAARERIKEFSLYLYPRIAEVLLH